MEKRTLVELMNWLKKSFTESLTLLESKQLFKTAFLNSDFKQRIKYVKHPQIHSQS